MIARPEGIILVTGPTGSGKTTTLYSLLNHINNRGASNIMTLEDPVEYPMALVRQTSVAEAAKLDFANGIRSMMRQDPDVILVGEIRDAETAEMAFRARDDRPSGVFDPAHQLGHRRHPAPARHRRAARHHGRQHHRHHRPAPGPPPVPALQDALPGRSRTKSACSARWAIRTRARCFSAPPAANTATFRLPRPGGDHGTVAHRRRHRRTDRPPLRPRAKSATAPCSRASPLADDGMLRVLDGSTSLEELARVVDLTDRM